jgi:hypothetical protein
MIKTDRAQIVEKIQKLSEILSSKEKEFQNPIHSLKKAEQESLKTSLCRKRVGKYVEAAVEQIKDHLAFSEIIDRKNRLSPIYLCFLEKSGAIFQTF